MNIDYPLQEQIASLRQLWKEAFGDSDAFLDEFFTRGFAPDRCRCVTLDDEVVAALYWFDCRLDGRPLAYLYAVATAKNHRGKGLCRSLVENTNAHLKELGYSGILLVPAEGLEELYAKVGYVPCTRIREFSCAAAEEKAELREVDAEEFAKLRQKYLPDGGVEQAGMEFFHVMARFYTGENFLVAVSREEKAFFAPELLGNADAAPNILAALGAETGTFRTPGDGKAFAMYHSLTDATSPQYFGLAFD